MPSSYRQAMLSCVGDWILSPQALAHSRRSNRTLKKIMLLLGGVLCVMLIGNFALTTAVVYLAKDTAVDRTHVPGMAREGTFSSVRRDPRRRAERRAGPAGGGSIRACARRPATADGRGTLARACACGAYGPACTAVRSCTARAALRSGRSSAAAPRSPSSSSCTVGRATPQSMSSTQRRMAKVINYESTAGTRSGASWSGCEPC